jgi:hypothetical protein
MPTKGPQLSSSVPARNAQFPWDEFAAVDYCDHNYLELRQDDREILELVAGWFAQEMGERLGGDAVDVGAGPNLYPTLSMLPHSRTVTLLEYSASNVDFLRAQTADLSERWEPFWQVVSAGGRYGEFAKARAMLAERVQVQQGSVFDLPSSNWDLGTMFFVAESISQDPAEFESAVRHFVRALRPGSPFAAAFMEHSAGYEVAGVRYPATPVGQQDVRACLGALSTQLRVERIEMQPAPLRPGYTGMIVAVGQAR